MKQLIDPCCIHEYWQEISSIHSISTLTENMLQLFQWRNKGEISNIIIISYNYQGMFRQKKTGAKQV